ncbi:MAG: transglycosylase SLT domain-containing protein [Myxococcota bacterium]
MKSSAFMLTALTILSGGVVLCVGGTLANPSATQPFQQPDLVPLVQPYELQLSRLSQTEALLRDGDIAAALEVGQSLRHDGPHGPEALRLYAWALFANQHDQQLVEILAKVDDPCAELRFLRGAAQHRLDAQNDQELKNLWWAHPDQLWGLFALRTLAPHSSHYSTSEKFAIARIIPAAKVNSRLTNDHQAAKILKQLTQHARRRGQLRRELQRASGLSLLRQELFTQAISTLRGVLGSGDRQFERAVRLSLGIAEQRRGGQRAALSHFDYVTRTGDDDFSRQANALLGEVLIEHRRYQEARARFEAQLLANPVGEARLDALWGLGWVAFRSGDFINARRFLATLRLESPYGSWAPAATYWAGRVAQELGDKPAAQALFAETIERFPLDYYAYRAQTRRNRQMSIPQGTAIPVPIHGEVLRLQQLVQAGLTERAKQDLARAVQLQNVGPHDLDKLSDLAIRLEAPSLAGRLAKRRARYFPEATPVGARALAPLFPKTYVRLLHSAAKSARVPPGIAIGLARQESAYNPRAVSSAGALGLMQLMPLTAKSLVQENKARAPFAVEDVLDPKLNVELGVRYLGRMIRAFGGRVEYALAAYNAGPGAVTRWRQARGDLPEDIFVEEIPYRETRDYVRRVLGWRQTYRFMQAAFAKTLPVQVASRNAAP